MTKYSLILITVILLGVTNSLRALPTNVGLSSLQFKFYSAQFVSVDVAIENNKVFIDWSVAENQLAYQFEIETSKDGKNFRTAAIIFGTDMPAKANYRFFEKAVTKKTFYRIKLVDKSQKVEYSQVVAVSPKQ